MLVEGGGQIGQIARHERHCIDVRARIRVTRIATFAVPFDGCEKDDKSGSALTTSNDGLVVLE
jgi:hypothetical protein